MVRNYVAAKVRMAAEYEVVFDDGDGNGFAFPCDRAGNLIPGIPEAAVKNYRRCLEEPERYARFNQVILHQRKVRENAHGTCVCGREVELYDAFCGASQCPKCGRWYNLYGQELLSPDEWEDADDWY